MLGVILWYLAKSNSAKLSLHRASLSCVYTDMNALGAKYYDDLRRSQYYIQLRHDWINDDILYSKVGGASEDGIKTRRTLQERPDAYVVEAKNRGEVEFRLLINRETLELKLSLFDVDSGNEKLWVKSECTTVSPSIFEQKREKEIELLRSKQKI